MESSVVTAAQKEAEHMESSVVTATQMKNNFGKYLDLVIHGGQIIVTRKGKEVARVVPNDSTFSFLTDSLIGILPGTHGSENAREEELRTKYGIDD